MARRRRYQTVLSDDYAFCAYCGDRAQAQDHFRPWSQYEEPPTIPACSSCNNTLQAHCHFTFGDRCQHLISRFTERYRKKMAVDFKALKNDTKGHLRDRLDQYEAKLRFVSQRIAYMKTMRELAGDILLIRLEYGTDEAKRLAEATRVADDLAMKRILREQEEIQQP